MVVYEGNGMVWEAFDVPVTKGSAGALTSLRAVPFPVFHTQIWKGCN